jgi:hypothetical protein
MRGTSMGNLLGIGQPPDRRAAVRGEKFTQNIFTQNLTVFRNLYI